MKNNKPIIIGIGELLWDIFPDGKKAGGAPVNFVYHASRLGAEGYAVSAVGCDALGTEILQLLHQSHIRHCIETTAYPTGTVMVELDHEGKPSYTIVKEVAWDYIPLTEQSVNLMKKADAICFGTLAQRSPVSRETISKLLTYPSEDTLRLFDINIRQHYYSGELIEACLEKANAFKINDEELKLIASMFRLEGSTDDICRWFMNKYRLRYLILTAGSEYSSIYGEREKSVNLTPKVKVADTVGAGDSFSGAFVYSILTGESLKAAHQKAVDIAAFVCTQNGAWPPFPLQTPERKMK